MNHCPIQSSCGGCPQLPTPPDVQRQQHIERVERYLRIPVTAYKSSPKNLGYRARITLSRGADGKLGYREHRSHSAIQVDHCAIARPEINAALALFPDVPRPIERVEFRSDGDNVVIHAHCKDKYRSPMAAWLESLDHIQQPLALNGRGVVGDPTTRLTVAGISHRLSPSTFYQVNLEVNQALVADVNAAIEAVSPTTVLDLFSGAGNLSLPLVAKGLNATLIEAHPTAVKDAKRTAADHELTADIRLGRVEDFEAGDAFFDAAILDPPRKGVGAVIEQVLLTRPKLVVMVSCNIATLAKDIKRAAKLGYQMDGVRLYEMFPHSKHVEVMGVLSSR